MQHDPPVVAAGGDHPTVGAEGDGVDGGPVAPEARAGQATGGHVDQLRRGPGRGRRPAPEPADRHREGPVVGRERQPRDPLVERDGIAHLLEPFAVPERHCPVGPADGDEGAVVGDGDGRGALDIEPAEESAGLDVPHVHAVPAEGRHPPAIGEPRRPEIARSPAVEREPQAGLVGERGEERPTARPASVVAAPLRRRAGRPENGHGRAASAPRPRCDPPRRTPMRPRPGPPGRWPGPVDAGPPPPSPRPGRG